MTLGKKTAESICKLSWSINITIPFFNILVSGRREHQFRIGCVSAEFHGCLLRPLNHHSGQWGCWSRHRHFYFKDSFVFTIICAGLALAKGCFFVATVRLSLSFEKLFPFLLCHCTHSAHQQEPSPEKFSTILSYQPSWQEVCPLWNSRAEVLPRRSSKLWWSGGRSTTEGFSPTHAQLRTTWSPGQDSLTVPVTYRRSLPTDKLPNAMAEKGLRNSSEKSNTPTTQNHWRPAYDPGHLDARLSWREYLLRKAQLILEPRSGRTRQ